LIDCGRRLAAQRDPVIADDVNAHEWVLLSHPTAGAAGDPLTLSSAAKATSFRIILWRCWAPSEHGIAHQNCASYWAGSAVTVPDNRCTNVSYPHESRPGPSRARSLSLAPSVTARAHTAFTELRADRL